LCLVCGTVSGNLEMIDFDCQGVAFSPWRQLVDERAPGLAERLVIEQSPSGGWHVVYLCASLICGNIKLAERVVVVSGSDEVELYGKKYKPRKVGDRWEVWLTLIETRGEGGIFLCHPTPGYQLVQGQFTELPVLRDDERETLLEVAWSLDELKRQPDPVPCGSDPCGRPGDDFNQFGDVREILRRHGWTMARGGENEYWRRPGKTDGWSATLKDGVFHVFSTSAAPFEDKKPYSPFAVYALLEHGGDYSTAAAALRVAGYGSDVRGGVDLVGIVCPVPALSSTEREPGPTDPGPLPPEMLRVPGFISEVMDYCLETAPYPNTVLAFAGALALQAFLGGRKVRDQADNRTNIYLLGLAYSAVGKDWPRKINTKVVHHIGLSSCLGDGFASGEGIQDLMLVRPNMFFQTDEIDGLLVSINQAKDARHESIMSTLLRMYSASNSVFPMRPKAGKTSSEAIDQPSLVVYGTAIPNHYYEALSERMLTNGFFARNIILESGPRSAGQEPRVRPLPDRVLEAAKWWGDFQPGKGNLENWHPEPAIVEYTDEALKWFSDSRKECENQYSLAESRGDPVGTTVWGRVNENSRKLALLYAISDNHRSPQIDLAAAQWATRFVMHQTRRMLYMAHSHVAVNPFHADCLRLMQKLREAPDRMLTHSVLLKRMKVDAQTFQKITETLILQGDIEKVPVRTAGRTGTAYRLLLP
jgi:hypothetical protein